MIKDMASKIIPPRFRKTILWKLISAIRQRSIYPLIPSHLRPLSKVVVEIIKKPWIYKIIKQFRNYSYEIFIIGARDGADYFTDYFRWAGIFRTIGFEPDEEETERLRIQKLYDDVLPYALGESEGERIFNITKYSGCSSFLLPNKNILNLLCEHPDWFEIVGKINIQISKLDLLINSKKIPCPDLMQIDVQGYELNVLRGCSENLDKISIIELEVEMYQLYYDEDTFPEIHTFMQELGFILFLLERQGPFSMNFVEANACYYNRSLYERNPQRVALLMDYCKLRYKKY